MATGTCSAKRPGRGIYRKYLKGWNISLGSLKVPEDASVWVTTQAGLERIR